MSSNVAASLLALEYRDVSFPFAGTAYADLQPQVAQGVPEHEVERRVAHAREVATAAAEHRLHAQFALQQEAGRQQVSEAMDAFGKERAGYFCRVEAEVVQLSLSIARKILQRESELDPTLLAALVRIALDRMQSGTEVKVRVNPDEVDLWCSLAGDPARWQVQADPSLAQGDCMVCTELGEANFGLEAQLCDVEQSFRGLLAHKPGAR